MGSNSNLIFHMKTWPQLEGLFKPALQCDPSWRRGRRDATWKSPQEWENVAGKAKCVYIYIYVYYTYNIRIYIYIYTDTISTLSRIIPVLDVIWDYEQQTWVPILFLGYLYLIFQLKFHMPNPMVKHHGHCGMAIRLGELGEPRIFKCTQISCCWLYISISHSNHMFLSFLVLYPMSTLQFPKWNHYLYWFVDVHMSICFMINQSKSNVYPYFAGLND